MQGLREARILADFTGLRGQTLRLRFIVKADGDIQRAIIATNQ